MKAKNKIGGLIILGGIALLGAYWFKKNKPTIASSQSKELEGLSNFYKTDADETYIRGIAPIKVGNFSLANVDSINPDSIICDGDGFLAKNLKIDCTDYCKENPTKCNGKSLIDWAKSGADFCKQNPTMCTGKK
jgi:hypothetical protein